MGGVIDIARRAARVDPNGFARRIHAHALRHRKINHPPVVAAAEPGAIVATAADREEETLIAAEVHRRDDIGDVHAARNKEWPLVDHAIVQFAGLLVPRVVSEDQLTAQALLEFSYSCIA